MNKTTAILLTFLSVPAAANPHHRHKKVEVYSPPPLQVADTEHFKTRFTAILTSAQKTVPILHEGDIALPQGLDDWTCILTPQLSSDNGSRTYRNVICAVGDGTDAVVVEAACPTNGVGSDAGEMLIANQKTKITADLTVGCKTEAVAPIPHNSF